MKTCGTCRYYYAVRGICEIPRPLWLEQADPMSNLTSDEVRLIDRETDALLCKLYYKRWHKGSKIGC